MDNFINKNINIFLTQKISAQMLKQCYRCPLREVLEGEREILLTHRIAFLLVVVILKVDKVN